MADLQSVIHDLNELTPDERRQLFSYLKQTYGENLDIPSRGKYDDDPEWDQLFANSQDMLAQLANEALKDLEEGRTIDLDPDNL